MLIKKKKLNVKLLESNEFNQVAAPSRRPRPQANGHHATRSHPADQELIENIKNKEAELLAQLNEEIENKRQTLEAEITQQLIDAQEKAATIVENAELEAERQITELNSEREAFIQEKNDFIKQVEIEKSKAFKQGREEAQVYIDEFNKYLGTFQNAEKNIMLSALPQITGIALDVAKQILAYEVKHNPELLEQQVLRSIDKVISSKGIIQIYLNPVDFGEADHLEKALSKLLDPSTRVVFVKDETVNKGSCMINTQGGRLNAKFSSQLQVIKASFEKYLGQEIIELPESPEPIEVKKNKDKTLSSFTDEPSDEDLELIDSEPLDLEFDAELDDLLDDLMQGINKEVGPVNTKAKAKTNSKSVSKKTKSGFNNKEKDLLMEDQMAKFFDDEFEDEESLEEDEDDSFDLEEEEEELDDDSEDLDDLEEFDEEDFAEDDEEGEEEDSEEDPRYPEY